MKISILTFIYIVLLAPALPAAKHPAMQANIYPPAKIEWKAGPPSLPPGAQIAVLEGDPTKEGMFVMRIRVPNAYHIPAHTHPKLERVTITHVTSAARTSVVHWLREGRISFAGPSNVWTACRVHVVWIESQENLPINRIGPRVLNRGRLSNDPPT